MIRLRPVCPAFETPEGALVHPAEAVAIEVMGEAATLHADMVKEAAAAVLHYFEYDLGRNTVSVSEFSAALKKALDGLGLEVDVAPTPAVPAEETDLQALLAEAPNGLELVFFPRLRTELRRKLEQGPGLLRFCGLDAAVAPVEEDARAVGLFGEGEPVARGAQTGEALDEIVFRQAEVRRDGGDFVGVHADEPRPAAASGASAAFPAVSRGRALGLKRGAVRSVHAGFTWVRAALYASGMAAEGEGFRAGTCGIWGSGDPGIREATA